MARVVEYAPEYFEAVRRAVSRMDRGFSLQHQPFVDYYYATRDWCRLYLLVTDDQTVEGMIGTERMRFEVASQEMSIGFGSNFHALRPGVGGFLFMQWMTSCPVGMVFGGSADTHKILRAQKWTYFDGARTYYLNSPYATQAGAAWWVVAVKWGLRHRVRSRLSALASRITAERIAEVSAQEEDTYREDLLPRKSPFVFRFAPTLESLRWRYALGLPFVRYRLFRILGGGNSVGYVIINESPERLIVAQCDGEDASTLAYGVLLSLLEVSRGDARPRGILLSCSHPEMQAIYERFGFKAKRANRPLAFGRLGGGIDLPVDTSNWLINYDWGDNGLRAPFQDHRS